MDSVSGSVGVSGDQEDPMVCCLTRSGNEGSARVLDVSSIMGGGTREKGQRGPRELPVETVLASTAPGEGGGQRGKVSGFCVSFVPQVTAGR